ADVEDEKLIEKMVQVSQDGRNYPVKWEHAADRRSHRFYADSIVRREGERGEEREGEGERERGGDNVVLVSWDGAPIGVENKGEHKLIIPPLGVFTALGAQVMNDGSSYISVQFSDPLLQNQDLNGLITINGVNLKFIIDGQTVKCYPDQNLIGSYQMVTHAGIQNTLGKKLSSDISFSIDFEDHAPSVKFIGNGVIIPSSNQIKIPFEATSLHTVDVTIIKVFENNISQFLQVNNLDGNNELKRVGRPMLKKAIKLNEDKLIDLRKTNTFSIDLDKLIKQEPGALYQIKLSFKRAYSLYRCDGIDTSLDQSVSEMEKLNTENWDEEEVKADQSLWDAAEEEYDWNGYNWNERNNPCHNSYYTQDKVAQRNIMTTDIGLVAKKGSKNEITFFATHLISTNPLAGISIDLLDYQQQIIGSGNTNDEGILKLMFNRKPYLAIAKNGSQKTYLKLDDGSSLSVSQFDVSGETVEKGLKGFIYGERGVWRPGDSIYLQFILEDKLNALPKDHPVTMELYNPLGTLYKRLVSNGKHYPFYDFRTATDVEAPTGTWTAKVKVGSNSFTKNIRVETVMPNRLKIELNFPGNSLVNNEEWKVKLKSRWLHGANAGGLKAKVDISLNPIVTQFKRYTDFVFDNPSKKFSTESTTLFEEKLNENGEAEFPVKMELQGDAAGMLQANFTTKVFEPGGAFSTDRFQIPFHAYTSYVGIKLPKGDVARGMLLTDTNHKVQVVCLDANGNLKKGVRKGRAQLFKIQWRWWWDRSEDDLSNYANAEEYNSLMDEEIEIVNGIGKFNIRVNYPDWGRYLILVTDEGGHSTGKAFYMDWPGWAGRAQKEANSSANILSIQLNKASYVVGEKATINFPTPLAGRALLSIENGSEIIKTYWIPSNGYQSSFEFPISKDMQPNVYAHVTLVQPHGQTSNDLPIRLYGMAN
ncbi:MAG: MG2 domain-containing protein, partial [Bacteroidia bacterium]|nr:MG2 domain-containing protein [Bacteroidia bacterium]